jgi:hypothetical protein
MKAKLVFIALLLLPIASLAQERSSSDQSINPVDFIKGFFSPKKEFPAPDNQPRNLAVAQTNNAVSDTCAKSLDYLCKIIWTTLFTMS